MSNYCKNCYELTEQLDQLKAENQILKDEFEILQNNFDSNNREWEEHTEGLIQVLTEIKEIAEEEVNNRMLFADKESFCDFNKILQKISECEVE